MVTVNIMFESKTVQELYEIPETGIITVKFPVTVSFYELLIMVGVPFEVQVDVQIQLQEIYYTVISKGLVVAAGKNKTTFTLTPEKSWAPTAEILVYLIDSDYANKQISKTLNIKGSGLTSKLPFTVPDMSTTWVATAFVVSENLGLGVVEEPVEVLVTLEKNDAFNIIVPNFNNISMLVVAGQQNVKVPREDATTVLFPLEPRKLGNITVTVKATSKAASDVLTKFILVKAEGIKYSYTQSEMFNLVTSGNGTQTASKNFLFSLPSDISCDFFHTGDLLVPSINGLQSLIQMPYGCGEQNMINFAPNIYILQYLFATQNLTNNIETKSIDAMNYGYQRELVYQREDGSFSAFGNDDPSGSTWLSAFVLRCFLKARQFILVDPVVLHDTLTWLLKHQKKNGEFWEPGRVINTQLQGGHYSPVTLTAYIMAALIEYPGILNSTQMTAATNYLESQMNEVISDNYTLSLVTYALSLVGRNKAKEGLDLLNSRAEHEGDLRFWKSYVQTASEWWQPSAIDIETTSYILLSHVYQNRVTEGIAVMKWLSQQRNSLGGFSSTQDTIVALQAMSLFASRYSISKPTLHISVEGDQMASTSFTVDSGNRMLLQTKPLHVIYNVHPIRSSKRRSTDNKDPFSLEITVHDDKENINNVTLNVCTSYLKTETSAQTGMAIMQVDLLSGFKLFLEGVLLKYPLKKIEESMDGKVNIYFDNINQTEVCVDIPTTRYSKVGYTQDAFVSVIDYYEPGRRTVKSYNSEVMQNLSPCTFCKDDCRSCKDNSDSLYLSPAKCLLTVLLMLYYLLL
uniref:Alpha-macroglobulin receptor-binding domain-containing protein n=1 Tax=Pyxicephalus adspersus TaxID=30357 RepID=A0AAV3AWI0_PYXAD|nr:TPA: hypothetical protein GDO54_010688 [Pyxicephalus adspersus]